MLVLTGSLTVSFFYQYIETYLKKSYIDFALVRELQEFGRDPVKALEERSLKHTQELVKTFVC